MPILMALCKLIRRTSTTTNSVTQQEHLSCVGMEAELMKGLESS